MDSVKEPNIFLRNTNHQETCDMPVRLMRSEIYYGYDAPYHNAVFVSLHHWIPEQSNHEFISGFMCTMTWN
jgi:hypothetical protein